MIRPRKRSEMWVGTYWETALINVHERWLHSRMGEFYGGYPYCENIHQIDKNIFLVALRDWCCDAEKYLYLCDEDRPVQWYTIGDTEYWDLSPIPF